MTKLEAVLRYFPQIKQYVVFPHANRIFFYMDVTEKSLTVKRKIRDYFGFKEYIRVFNPDNKSSYHRVVNRWVEIERELVLILKEHPTMDPFVAEDLAKDRVLERNIVKPILFI
jgi:hypothetical protein